MMFVLESKYLGPYSWELAMIVGLLGVYIASLKQYDTGNPLNGDDACRGVFREETREERVVSEDAEDARG